jgi:hypothetical protein
MSLHCGADHDEGQTMSSHLSAITGYLRGPNRAGRTRTGDRKSHQRALLLERLEDRQLLTTISVSNATVNEIGNVSAFVASGSGGLSVPRDLVMGPDGNVYVVFSESNSVIRYTPSGQLLGTFVSAGSGGSSKKR